VFVTSYDTFYAGFDTDNEILSRLAAEILYRAASDIGFAKKRHIDERHSTHAVTEHEQIAGQGERRFGIEVETLKTQYDTFVYGSFAGAVYPRIDIAERESLFHDTTLDSLVVDRPQHSHVKRDGIAHEVATAKPLVVLRHHPFVQPTERNVPSEKSRKTAYGATIVACRAEFAARIEFDSRPLHIFQYADAAAGCLRFSGFNLNYSHNIRFLISIG
jgi:hypothetical protein